jgi:hypothetical protein
VGGIGATDDPEDAEDEVSTPLTADDDPQPPSSARQLIAAKVRKALGLKCCLIIVYSSTRLLLEQTRW